MIKKHRVAILRILSLVLVIVLSFYIFSIRNEASKLAVYGYPGIFLLSFLAYATVLLPAPGVAVVFTMGAVFNPFGVALAAGAGAALGELTGYLAGFSGQAVIERTKIYQGFHHYMQRNGFFTVLILSGIPNPFFDLAGIAAGALKMRPVSFLLACWIGETIKMLAFAFAGAGALKWLTG